MSRIAKTFVAGLFALIGVAFIAPTAVLIWEFGALDWQTLLFSQSNLFFFFPVFGVLALVAFYAPAVAFSDFYLQHVKYGTTRYGIGFLVVTAAALWFGAGLARSELRGIWEVAPHALLRDAQDRPAGQPACRSGAACSRQPFLTALQMVRSEGQLRSSVSELARSCKIDQLVERPVTDQALRYCFPAGQMLNTDQCCNVQRTFAADLAATVNDPASRSLLSRVDEIASYLKAFFIVVIFVIGALLVVWQRRIRQLYAAKLEDIENGIIVGAVAMILWFLMDYGYQQTSDLLFGRHYSGLPIRLSFVVLPWAVLLVLYFMRSVRAEYTQINPGQLIVGLASGVAALQYEKVANLSFRLLGAGAEWKIFAGLLCVDLVMLILILFPNILQTVFGQLREESSRKHPPLT